MLYLVFCDGQLRTVSTDKTDAAVLGRQLLKDEGYSFVQIVGVNGYISEEMHKDDKEEA